jgi:hypothetical protein
MALRMHQYLLKYKVETNKTFVNNFTYSINFKLTWCIIHCKLVNRRCVIIRRGLRHLNLKCWTCVLTKFGLWCAYWVSTLVFVRTNLLLLAKWCQSFMSFFYWCNYMYSLAFAKIKAWLGKACLGENSQIWEVLKFFCFFQNCCNW